MLSMSSSIQKLPRPRKLNSVSVQRELENLCASLPVGEQLPTRSELMRRYNASSHAVLKALDELRREGVVVIRNGAGTFVADRDRLTQNGVPLNDAALPADREIAAERGVHNIVAIGEPDGGVFDHAMMVLMKQAKAAKLAVNCRFMSHEEVENFRVPPAGTGARGYVLFRRHFLPLAERLQAHGHRVVFVGTPYADSAVEVPCVSGDQEHGGYLTVKHLLDLGHRRLAFHFEGDYQNLRRWVGCQRALKEAAEEGLEIHFEILELEFNDPSLVQAYFQRPGAPTAILSWNDDMAIKLLTLLQRAGIRVPEEVSLVGYDNLNRSAEVFPALTTVDGALGTQIQAALRMLSQPTPPSRTQSIIVMPTIVCRDSSAPVLA